MALETQWNVAVGMERETSFNLMQFSTDRKEEAAKNKPFPQHATHAYRHTFTYTHTHTQVARGGWRCGMLQQ